MSEWVSVLAVFWILWALDGLRLGPRQLFTLLGRGAGRRPRAGVHYQKWSLPGPGPGSWRLTGADVPIALSPAGLCNRPVGAAGRPAERTLPVRAFRWEEVREAGVAGGWVFVNGARLYPDTGHLTARELLAIARLAGPAREARIRMVIGRWFRPAHLRRRAVALTGRTLWPARLNAISLTALAGLTIYVVGDVAARLPTRWSEGLAAGLPWLLLALLGLHVAAVVMTWRTLRRLKPVTAQKRGANLFSALMMPPQALRLRAIAGEGYFPPQHPLALVVAFGGEKARREWAFNVMADLRWPLAPEDEPPLAGEVAAQFRVALEARLEPLLRDAGVTTEALLAAPVPDAPASRSYCPRCRAQFVAGGGRCPNGIELQPVPARR